MNIAIRAVNRILKHIGLRIFPITKFKLATEAFIREKKCIKFIQVGANDGVRFDDLYFTVTSSKWKGLVIEPLPNMYERLVSNYQDHPNVIPLNIAIHPSSKTAPIYHVDNELLCKYPDCVAGIASMNKEHLLNAGIAVADISAQIVQCKTIMEVLDEYDFYDVDLLQIDTEGFDFEVIKTIDFKKLKPRLIKFEWMNLSASDQSNVSALLIQHGYKIDVEKDGSDCIAWLANKVTF